MKALDTNILVRFLLNDDKDQSLKVYHLFKKAEQENHQFFVPALVILELNWVLNKHYQLSRHDTIEALQTIMGLPILVVEYADVIYDCLTHAKDNTFDLSDLLIGYIARANNCITTLTFDNKASKSPLFSLLTTK